MHRDVATTEAPKRSPFFAAFGAIAAAGTLVVWSKSGQAYDLLAALGFGALTPVWYLLPISLTAPIQSHFKRGRTYLPKWAQVLTFVGMLLLLASAGLRWAS
jgi:hypothetical protein